MGGAKEKKKEGASDEESGAKGGTEGDDTGAKKKEKIGVSATGSEDAQDKEDKYSWIQEKGRIKKPDDKSDNAWYVKSFDKKEKKVIICKQNGEDVQEPRDAKDFDGVKDDTKSMNTKLKAATKKETEEADEARAASTLQTKEEEKPREDVLKTDDSGAKAEGSGEEDSAANAKEKKKEGASDEESVAKGETEGDGTGAKEKKKEGASDEESGAKGGTEGDATGAK